MNDGLMSTNLIYVQSLPHFSFLLFKVDVVLDLWNVRIPFVVRIHLDLSQQKPVCIRCFFFLIHVAVHTVVNSVPVTHLAKSARHNSHKRFFFAGL